MGRRGCEGIVGIEAKWHGWLQDAVDELGEEGERDAGRRYGRVARK